MTKHILIISLLFISNLSLAQKLDVSYTAGLGFRSYLFGINGKSVSVPGHTVFVADRNFAGFGIHAGVKIESEKLGLEFYPTLRYAVSHLYWIMPADSPLPRGTQKKFFVDLNSNLYLKGKIFNFGAGLSFLNVGSSIYEPDFEEPDHLENEKTSTQYMAWSLFVSKEFGRYEVEAKLYFVPNSEIIYPYGYYNGLGLRGSYLLKKKGGN